MAQNVKINGVTYSAVPSIEVPKQGGGTASFVDTTDADAVASEIDMGKTAYVNGIKLTGTRSGGGGSYTAGDGIDITNDVISLETASANDIGGIKVGSGLSIDANGVLSASGGGGGGGTSFTETELFSNASGVNSGTINLSGNISDYDLIDVQVGGSSLSRNSNLYLSSYVLSSTDTAEGRIITTRYDTSYVNWSYSTDTSIKISAVGGNAKLYKIIGIKFGGGGGSYSAGDGIDITNDVISLEKASANDLGGIKVGSGLSIDGNGVLSATGGGSNQDVFTLSTHSIDKTFTCQNTEYLSDTTVSKEFIFKIQTNYKRCVYKEGSDLAICGIANVGGVAYGIFLSLSPNGVVSLHTNEGGDWIYDRIGSLGTIHDDVNNIDWYYSGNGQVGQPFSSIVSSPAPTKPIMSGTYSSIINAATQLLEDASPQVIEVPIKEDLFNPTNCTVTSGNTITDNTLKSLINGYRPIKINNETYYFIKLDSGTYYYKNFYNTITVDSSWVMTITADGGQS